MGCVLMNLIKMKEDGGLRLVIRGMGLSVRQVCEEENDFMNWL